MQVLRATEVFKNIRNIDNAEFEESGNIVLDFSNIENIDLIKLTKDLEKYNIPNIVISINKPDNITDVYDNLLN